MEAEIIIDKIKIGKRLNENEIDYMVTSYMNKSITDDVMGEFLLTIKNNGLSYKETFYLTKAMINSGEILDLSNVNRVIVDKHSTGGVGDKTTLVVGPIVASLGLGVLKMSGRSLGFTGGTIDKLMSIPGYRVNLTNEEFIENVNEIGISVISQTKNLAPADKKIYALRDEIGAVTSTPLIASSIMSKKIASGSKYIVIDLKVGSGAFMKNLKEASILANYMIKIGKYFDRKVICVLTDMDNPLGKTVGNAIEVKEAIEFFDGIYDKRFMDLVVSISSHMVSLGKNISYKKAVKEVNEVITNGQAKAKFYEWINAQGGQIEKVILSENKLEVKSTKNGFITHIDPLEISKLVSSLGAGRVHKEDEIDLSVGVLLNKTLYDEVKTDDTLLTIYYNKTKPDISNIENAFKVESIIKKKEDIIKSVIK